MRDSQLLRAVLLIALASIAQPAAIQAGEQDPALQAFLLDESSEHIFHFRQAQKGEMTLILEVEGSRGERDRQELTHLDLTIEVNLVNHTGHTACHAVGSPTDGMSTDNWVLRTRHGEAAFWHHGCAGVKLKRSESYTLTVRVRDVGAKIPKIKVVPIFERSTDYGP
jgi:hypothetical protein